MKFPKGLLVFVLIYTALAIASDKNFYAQLGFGLVASKGNFNEDAIVVKNKEGDKGNLHPARLKILSTPDLTFGVHLKEYTLALNLQYWSADQTLSAFPADVIHEESTRILRIGPEFTYNIYWPEFFQVGIGGGLAYTNVKTEDALFFGAKTYDVDFSGIAIGAIANLRYAITDHIAMVSSLKFYESVFWDLDSAPLDDDQLDENLWQTFILITMAVQYQF